MVPVEGIEPPLLAEHDFESCASTSSATRAQSGNRQSETIAASFVEHDRLGKPATTFPDHAPADIYIFDPRTRQKKINPRRRRPPGELSGLASASRIGKLQGRERGSGIEIETPMKAAWR